MIQFRQEKYLQLREDYPLLTYERMDYFVAAGILNMEFSFTTKDIAFNPQLQIPLKPFFALKDAGEIQGNPMIENLVFHIGMVELVSYWKATCSPDILVKPHKLSEVQIQWWKKIYFSGLGEFFYVNGIENTLNDFVNINSLGTPLQKDLQYTFDESVIVPVGGGKDSVVTLELMKSGNYKVFPLILNPRGASLQTIETAELERDKLIEIHRKIDPRLLELNAKGYLNGHTPFSALLGFVSLLCAVLSGKRHIALSNESSANESTVLNSEVNHQYSKSFTFEKDFREYVAAYISKDPNYFSFLRPISEIQIAKLFSRFEKYHGVFKSCNVGSKTDVWCGNCSKCLFTFILLSPFISKVRMLEIYGSDLLNKPGLRTFFDELIGVSDVKPFECVGTTDEVNWALQMLLKQIGPHDLPYLLKHYLTTLQYQQFCNISTSEVFTQFDSTHFLLPEFENLLKSALV